MAQLWCDGPIAANALVSPRLDTSDVERGRDLSDWLGLTQRPHSTGGKERAGRIPRVGQQVSARLSVSMPSRKAQRPMPWQGW